MDDEIELAIEIERIVAEVEAGEDEIVVPIELLGEADRLPTLPGEALANRIAAMSVAERVKLALRGGGRPASSWPATGASWCASSFSEIRASPTARWWRSRRIARRTTRRSV